MNTSANSQKINRSKLIILLAIFLFFGFSWALFYFADTEIEPIAEEQTVPQPTAIPAPPDLPTLATAALQGGFSQATPEELEEERQLEEKQVAFAAELLANPDAENRAAGAEQLAAYPTEAAEKQLTTALSTDIDAHVRAAAAQSLAAFKKPKDESVDTLLAGLLDADRIVRRDALNTLQIYAGREPHSAQAKKIFSKLDQLTNATQLQPDTLRAVRGFLADQASTIKQANQ